MVGRCIVCEEEKQLGIHLYLSFICTDCEIKMIHTEPRDQLYDFYVERLKRHQHTMLYT